jgi:hypothetical protein
MMRALWIPALATCCVLGACSGGDREPGAQSQAIASVKPILRPSPQPLPGPPIFVEPDDAPDMTPAPNICAGHIPTAIDLDAWDGTSSLWAGHRGVVVSLGHDDETGGTRFGGVDTANQVFLWQGYGKRVDLEQRIYALSGSCKPNPLGPGEKLPINDLPIPGIPKKDPPVQTGTEQPKTDAPTLCDYLQYMLSVAQLQEDHCHY